MRKTVSPPPIVYLDVDDDDENESSQFQRQVESLNKNSFRHEKKRKNVEQAIDSSRCCVHEHKRPCSQTSSISRFIKSTIDEQQTDEDFDDRSTSDQIPWLNIPTQIPKFEKPAPKPNIISSLRIPSDDQPSAFRRVPPKHNGQLRSSTEISPENLQTHLPLPFPEQLQNSIPTKIVKKRASPTVQTKKVLQTPAVGSVFGKFSNWTDKKWFSFVFFSGKQSNSHSFGSSNTNEQRYRRLCRFSRFKMFPL